MSKVELPPGWTHQAYRFEVDRPGAHPAIFSHEGAKRFAWNWGLSLVEDQLHAREVFRVLALRQGATDEEATSFAERAASIPYLVELNEKRRKDHERLIAEGTRKESQFRPASEWCPWTAEAMRYVWNRVKDEVAPWWAENSKECYSSAFESLSQAFRNFFDSRDGNRGGSRVGWPKHKSRRSRRSVGFTTGGIRVLDRHHVQLPVVGTLRVKEPTDKLRLKIQAGETRVHRATLVTEGGKTYVSFGVSVKKDVRRGPASAVGGHDVGISALVTSSDGTRAENPHALKRARKKISRYQRRMDRQHRTGSPQCFDAQGRHIPGTCYWKNRSTRAKENQARLQKTHAKAARIRRDAMHKASHRAATRYRVNIIEDLNVAGMGRKGYGKRGFNRAQRDAALAEFRRELSYKSSWYGAMLWIAPWWYPSSKTCSRCRHRKDKLSRSAREFHCEHCGLVIDRDLNAAKNLAALAELACVCLMAQLVTGEPVDWSKLPVRPYGWEPDQSTRSSRGCARAGGRKANGAVGKTARHRAPARASDGDAAVDREAASHRHHPVPVQSEVA
jgi:putative transposase